MHSKIAKEMAFDVVEANNGVDCLDKARAEKPDAILLDMNMPTMNGLEVMQALRNEGLVPKVLVITADIQDTTRKRCQALGAVDFLNKPVDEIQLRAKLTELAGHA